MRRPFTRLDGAAFARTLTQRLAPVADSLRDLNTRFGLRPYRVFLVRTTNTAGLRGKGEEVIVSECEILPVPELYSLDTLTQVATVAGFDEQGSVGLREISVVDFDEDVLRGYVGGQPPSMDERFFYEIRFLRRDGQPGERRRCVPQGVPEMRPDEVMWQVRLARATGRDNGRDGGTR